MTDDLKNIRLVGTNLDTLTVSSANYQNFYIKNSVKHLLNNKCTNIKFLYWYFYIKYHCIIW